MNHLPLLLSGILAVLLSRDALAAPSAFDQANKLYEEGRYQEAIQEYQAVLTNHVSAAAQFNLGNAYFKSGQVGQAIAQYQQAELLAPRDPDVLANLRFARQRVDGPSYRAGWLQRRSRVLTPHEWALAATGAVWLFFAVQIARQWQPKRRAWFRPWATFTGALAGLLLGMAVWVSKSAADTHLAVVVQREAVMRLGPFEESQSALTLKDGAELRILDRKNGWLQVTTGGREIGWVRQDAVRELQPG